MREGCFQTKSVISRLGMACSIGVVPCFGFRLSSGVLVGLGMLGLAVGPGVVSDSVVLSAGDRVPLVRTLLRLSLPTPGAHRCPSCGLTCLRLQQKMCLR